MTHPTLTSGPTEGNKAAGASCLAYRAGPAAERAAHALLPACGGTETRGGRGASLKTAGFAPKSANTENGRSRRMTPSSSQAGGPNPAKVTKLPDASREEMLEAAGLSGSAHWAELDEADTADLEARGFLVEGGWHAVEPGKGRGEGTTSHRGVLQGDEYVDHEKLVSLVEAELGFTCDGVHAVYRQGPLSEAQRELRGQIDARLLALCLSGANMALLARILGFSYNESREAYWTMEQALKRARAAAAVAV